VRTTVEFDPDTAKAVEQLRAEGGRGVSEAVNELIRRGMLHDRPTTPFVPRTRPVGIAIDVSNVADALDVLDGPKRR
jgi:hypothetical protein